MITARDTFRLDSPPHVQGPEESWQDFQGRQTDWILQAGEILARDLVRIRLPDKIKWEKPRMGVWKRYGVTLTLTADGLGPYGWFSVEIVVHTGKKGEASAAVHTAGPRPGKHPPGIFMRGGPMVRASSYKKLFAEALEKVRLELWAAGEDAISKLASPQRVAQRWAAGLHPKSWSVDDLRELKRHRAGLVYKGPKWLVRVDSWGYDQMFITRELAYQPAPLTYLWSGKRSKPWVPTTQGAMNFAELDFATLSDEFVVAERFTRRDEKGV